MNLLVADTGPLNYLIRIGAVDPLRELASEVIVPISVLEELRSGQAPPAVRKWALSPPDWLRVVENPPIEHAPTSPLSVTDLAVIQLASRENAILLMDESKGRETARSMNVPVVGTIGVLLLGAERALVDFPSALTKLQQTNMFLSPRIIQDAWNRYRVMHPE